jgi:hypothetical protein
MTLSAKMTECVNSCSLTSHHSDVETSYYHFKLIARLQLPLVWTTRSRKSHLQGSPRFRRGYFGLRLRHLKYGEGCNQIWRIFAKIHLLSRFIDQLMWLRVWNRWFQTIWQSCEQTLIWTVVDALLLSSRHFLDWRIQKSDSWLQNNFEHVRNTSHRFYIAMDHVTELIVNHSVDQ